MEKKTQQKKWALILGASSGFGGATALELSKHNYNIIGVHLDRQATMANVHTIIKKIQHNGGEAWFYNINAADAIKRQEILDEIEERFNEMKEKPKINVMVHSLAFGSLRPYISKKPEDAITQAQMVMTLDVMAHTLVYWTQGLVFKDLLAEKAKIWALTSAGSHSVIPYYGAVSAAKAALEAHVRQLAVELGYLKVCVNAIKAGVTDTPALAKIPGSDKMIESAKLKNPMGRLTTPEDVAKVISVLSEEAGDWISGSVIAVDGGEDIVNFTGEKMQRKPQ
jgi:NAD(P)-dependent dehydrogenase (short-subunit alcohol dehydrogenase family)